MEKVYQRPCKKICYDSIHSSQHQSQLQGSLSVLDRLPAVSFSIGMGRLHLASHPGQGCNAGGQPGIHGCRTNRCHRIASHHTNPGHIRQIIRSLDQRRGHDWKGQLSQRCEYISI